MAVAHIHVKVNPEIKTEAEEVLNQIGISMSDLFNMTMRRVIVERRIPFDTTIPEPAMPREMSADSLEEWKALIDKRAKTNNGIRYTTKEIRTMFGLEKEPAKA